MNKEGVFIIEDLQEDFQATSEVDQLTARREMQGKEVICPHCWCKFPIEDIMYIAQHPDLLGDDVVPGEFEHRRFTPSRFTPEGHAIDARGMTSPDMACPSCHLRIPQAIIDLDSLFFSIIGAPASGKSYFLTSMVWSLRNMLSSRFNFAFTDADPQVNAVLNEYEQQLFLNPRPNEVTVVKKTQLTGDLYRSVKMNDMDVSLPMPFIFKLQPTDDDLDADRYTKNMILYDNAGEHFQPGREDINQPATRHLVHSNGLIFLFDPSIDAKMRLKCTNDDPQIELLADKITNQETLLAEMIRRIRLYSGMKTTDKYDYPLIISVSKYDLWRELFPDNLEQMTPWSNSDNDLLNKLDLNTVLNVSFHIRQILIKILPSFVKTAETFASQVFFIPTSSFGSTSEVDQKSGLLGIRPGNIKSIWTEVPILLLLASYGYIAFNKSVPRGDVIEKYKLTSDSITFTVPGSDDLIQLPKIYFGASLHHTETDTWFTLPGKFTPTPEKDEFDDDDFWNQPASVKTPPA
jgi:hypothetical protein